MRGGRARDIVSTLDALVEDAARARGWRVARVQAADEVDEAQRRSLSEALARLTGNPVDLQVTIDPAAAGWRGGRRSATCWSTAAPATGSTNCRSTSSSPRRPTELHEGRETTDG